MRKASLIISIITIPVYILYSIYMGNVLEKMVELEKEKLQIHQANLADLLEKLKKN